MIQAGDFRKGTTFEMDGDVWQIIDFQHVKPGKGAAFVRTKIRSVMTGSNRDMTFNPNEKYEEARIETREMQYLYNDGTSFVFMDTTTYEQLEIPEAQVERESKFLKENMVVNVIMHDGETLGVDLPNTVDLEVAETEPNIKGDTSSGGGKPATMETGLVVNVPFFINQGDVLTINTADGTYVSRANK